MTPHVVLYREKDDDVSPPQGFHCEADNGDHAEEQCENAHPGCDVLWIVETDDYHKALTEYWL